MLLLLLKRDLLTMQFMTQIIFLNKCYPNKPSWKSMVLVFKYFPLYGAERVCYHLTEPAKVISLKDSNSSRKKKSFLSRAGGGLLLCTLKCLLCSKKILGSVD